MRKILSLFIFVFILVFTQAFGQVKVGVLTATKVNKIDSTGHAAGSYATRSALLDTTLAVRGALVDTALAIREDIGISVSGEYVAKVDSTGHVANHYSTRSALLDTTTSVRGALVDTANAHALLIGNKVNKADSTGHSVDSYASRAALVDTSTDIRSALVDTASAHSLRIDTNEDNINVLGGYTLDVHNVDNTNFGYSKYFKDPLFFKTPNANILGLSHFGVSNYTHISTFQVDSTTGAIGSAFIDDRAIVARKGSRDVVRMGSSNYFAVIMDMGDPRSVISFSVDNTGDISDTNIDTLQVYASGTETTTESQAIEKVANSSYFLTVLPVYDGTGDVDSVCVKTVEYNSTNGHFVGIVDSLRVGSLNFIHANGSYNSYIFRVASSNYYGVLCNKTLLTIPINPSTGEISTPSDTLGVLSVAVGTVHIHRIRDTNFYGIGWQGAPFSGDVGSIITTVEISPIDGKMTYIEKKGIDLREVGEADFADIPNTNLVTVLFYGINNWGIAYKIYDVSDGGVFSSAALDSGKINANNQYYTNVAYPLGTTNYVLTVYDSSDYSHVLSFNASYTANVLEGKLNAADSTSHSINNYATYSALIDTALLKVNKADSISHSAGNYASYSALIDTASSHLTKINTNISDISTNTSDISTNTFNIALKLNKADSTAHSSNNYSSYSALIDTASALRGAIGSSGAYVAVGDSTSHSPNNYASFSALSDTASSHLTDISSNSSNIDLKVNKADSTSHSADNYAAYSALIDTASAHLSLINTNASDISTNSSDIALKVNKSDSTGHVGDHYASRSALLDTASAHFSLINTNVSNIDLKVNKADSTLHSPSNYATRSALVDTASNLRTAINSKSDLSFDNALTVDSTYSGIHTSDAVGESVNAGDVCYMKLDGAYWKANASASTTMPGIVLVTSHAAAAASATLLHIGYFRLNSWAWTVGGLIYTSTTSGGLTQTAPSAAGEQVQAVGYAVTADIIYFNPSLVVIEVQ